MCGIAGILKFDARDSAEAPRLRRMRDVLAHRGPDGEGHDDRRPGRDWRTGGWRSSTSPAATSR